MGCVGLAFAGKVDGIDNSVLLTLEVNKEVVYMDFDRDPLVPTYHL